MNSKTPSKKNVKKEKDNIFFLDFVRITGAIPALIWKRPKTYYLGDKKKCLVKGGVLIASNHITFTDPILLYCVFWRRRIRFLATKDLYTNPLVSFLFSAAGCIQVDKQNFSMRTLHSIVDKLKDGKPILIFPEGEVNKSDEMLSFKSGAVLMAQLSGAPIQPVYITHRERWYQRSITVVGEPIDIKSMCSRFPTMDELQAASDRIRDAEKALEEHYNNNIKRKV